VDSFDSGRLHWWVAENMVMNGWFSVSGEEFLDQLRTVDFSGRSW
jgi:hypothetical protein